MATTPQADGHATGNPRWSHPKPPLDAKPPLPEIEPDYGEDTYVGFGRLEGRTALVTGGDGGIGRAVALAFAREGADVAITYLEAEREGATKTVRLVQASGRKCVAIAADLARARECDRVVDEAAKALGRVDVLVHNSAARSQSPGSIEALDADRARRTFEVNVVAMFGLVHAALPHLREGAAIITVAPAHWDSRSPTHRDSSAELLDSAVARGAIVTFTTGLAHQLAERGIRVNCIAPGPGWAPWIAPARDHIIRGHARGPRERIAQPVELAPAFVFLACDESRNVSGEILGVTGAHFPRKDT